MPATVSPASPRGRPPRGQRRAALLDATLRVIAREGAAGASHRAVAAEAGIPLGSTTYYFASREEMLLEALRHAAAQDIARTRQAIAALAARPAARVDWTRELTAWVLDMLEREHAAVLVARHHLQLEALRRPELRPVYAEWTAAALEHARAVLGAAGSDDPAADAPVLVAAIDGLALNQLVLLDREARPRIVAALVGRLMGRLTGA